MVSQRVLWMVCLTVFSLMASLALASGSSLEDMYNPPEDYEKHSLEKNKTRFNEEEKKLIVQIHNSYRSVVEPPATDMRELHWDMDLENYAWNHTQTCTGVHSRPRDMLKKWGPYNSSWEWFRNMGENLYLSYGPSYSIKEAIWMFWKQGQYYTINNNTCTPLEECGYFLTMVNAENWRVGCAINSCHRFTKAPYPTPAAFMTCNYNAPYLGISRPYTVGVRSSECSDVKSISNVTGTRPRLCGIPKAHLQKLGITGDMNLLNGITTNPSEPDTTLDLVLINTFYPVTKETYRPWKTYQETTQLPPHSDNDSNLMAKKYPSVMGSSQATKKQMPSVFIPAFAFVLAFFIKTLLNLFYSC